MSSNLGHSENLDLSNDFAMTVVVDSFLDVSGVCCPIPLIQLTKTINTLIPGQIIEISGNDPIFETSIQDYCLAQGHTIIDVFQKANNCIAIQICVGNTVKSDTNK